MTGRTLKPLSWRYTLGGKVDRAGFVDTIFDISRQKDGTWDWSWYRGRGNPWFGNEPSADHARAKCQSLAQEVFDNISEPDK